MPRARKQLSALHFMLRALIPYTRENLQLSTNPHRFFNDLERLSGYNHKTFQNVARKAEKEGLIRREGRLLEITAQGRKSVQPFIPARLGSKARLMVIFDIPEDIAADRRRLRLLLKQWQFSQVQKSVWVSDYDYRKLLVKAVDELGLESCVQIFECAKLYPKH